VLHITDNFICRLSPKRCHSPLAWLFSITVVLICIVIPLLTFSTDVAFYLLGRHPHEETAAFLEKAKIIVENLTATNPVFRQYVLNSKKTENAFARAKELSAIRHSKHRAPSGLRHRHGKREVSPFTYAIPKQAVDEDQMLNTSTSKPFSMTAAVTTKNSTPSKCRTFHIRFFDKISTLKDWRLILTKNCTSVFLKTMCSLAYPLGHLKSP